MTTLEQDHQYHLHLAEQHIAIHRDEAGIEPIWRIEVQIVCPEQLPDSEAALSWHAEVWFARILLRCDTPEDLIPWLVRHELEELARWRTTDTMRTTFYIARDTFISLDRLLEILERQYAEQRNQEIETKVSLTFGGKQRPYHLSRAYEYCDVHRYGFMGYRGEIEVQKCLPKTKELQEAS